MIENLIIPPSPEIKTLLHGSTDEEEMMIYQAETADNHSEEFLVQLNKELFENPWDVKDFSIFVEGNPQAPDAWHQTLPRPLNDQHLTLY